ncbi:aspartate aminotransferase family protein [Candidatus Gottesmanbacteria bacterium]|nr:aspartate aminotransferase family protein [Candidatus Gottesmanbacteria bacterium]
MEDTSHKNYFVPSYPDRGVTFVDGEGPYLIEKNGTKYLDFGSNYGVSIFGYNHPRITRALERQLHRLMSLHGSFGSNIREEAARALVERCGGKTSRVFFSNSGSEAVEAAIKFAKVATGKSRFLAFDRSYHGKTLGALSATSGEKYRQAFEPLLWHFTHIPLGDKTRLKEAVTEETAAIIIEPVQGEGGIRTASTEYLRYVQEFCRANNVLLIADEIQCGTGRTGTFLSSEQHGLAPDIVCLGKGIAGGVPAGVTLVSESIAGRIPLHLHTTTFGGNPLTSAGIVAVLKEFEDDALLAHIRDTGRYFLEQLKTLSHSSIIDVRGSGLMLGMELGENVTQVLKALQEHRIIAIPAGSNIIRFLPPYIITNKEIDTVISVLKKFFNS